MPNTSWSKDNPKPTKSQKFRNYSKKVDGQIRRSAEVRAKSQGHRSAKKVPEIVEVPVTGRRLRGWG